ncbi:hypothetical protein B0H16DRAFT_1321418, partial [Mycena metata]
VGFETARVVAKYAKLVIITGYNAERLKLSEQAIQEEIPHANIRRLILDQSSLASVRKAAEVVNTTPDPLHVLINNASAPIGAFKLTEDGLERQFATDHVGPFLLTKLLAPKLLAAQTPTYTPRVVFVSSTGHTPVDFDVLATPDPAKHDDYDVYSQAKSANILTALELSKRSKGTINAYGLHPGIYWVPTENRTKNTPGKQFPRVLPRTSNQFAYCAMQVVNPFLRTVTAAFDPRLSDKPGAFLEDCTVANNQAAPHAVDPANAERLWKVTEKIIGETFTF